MTPTWLQDLQDRHRAAMTSSEFLKAVRALSARYVERRAALRDRSPLDSAGKRAAFAAFYAPLHFLITREIVRALGISGPRGAGRVRRIVDLGCGTGVASAAWALEEASQPRLVGIDRNAWALTEAKWNWTRLGLHGTVRRMDLGRAAGQLTAHGRRSTLSDTAIVAGWSVNELPDAARARLLPVLLECISRGASVLVIEPVAAAVSPWWREWELAWRAAGGQASEWRFSAELPPSLASTSEAAGFRRETLTARSLWHDRQTG